jgi:hypothetical protein
MKIKCRLTLACAVAMASQTAAAVEVSPVTLVRTIYMPEITGDFDHFTVDLKRGHLFVSAEVHHSIEMFDLKTGDHLQSIGGFKTPHSIAFAAEKDELMVADGGDSSLVSATSTRSASSICKREKSSPPGPLQT